MATINEQDLFSVENTDRLKRLLEGGWSESTRVVYGTGLLVYHVWCDKQQISEDDRAPVHSNTILMFISALAGGYSGEAISNYVAGVRAWHYLHGLTWDIEPNMYVHALKSAKQNEPASSKTMARPPCLPSHLEQLRNALDLNRALDAAVWACATSLFYGVTRTGELTVPRLNGFDATQHVTISSVRQSEDRNGNPVTIIHVPFTKATRNTGNNNGEDIFWARQVGVTDPAEALENHIRVNNPQPLEHLFCYSHKNARRPLTKYIFNKTVKDKLASKGLEPLAGHSFRIGGTLEYLLRGVSFETVKSMGWWASDAFQRYLRRHGEAMAPFVQANPNLHAQLSRLQIPIPPARG